MNGNPAIGFIGFGEAGSNIANGLNSSGVHRLFAFDLLDIRERAVACRATVVESPAALAASSDIIFSAVTASSALAAATEIAPFLAPHQFYADINSVSPGLKQSIDAVIRQSGAAFVESAVMAPVPPYGHRVPMLLGGGGAEDFAKIMTPFGMRLEVLPGPVGRAAAVKMCRSIVVKGLEALIFESVLAASRYGAEERMFESLDESFPGMDWKKLADYMIGRVVVHGLRRAHEMEEVVETLAAIGIEPVMAAATARRQAWSAELNLKSHFGANGPACYRDVLDVINNK